MTHPTLLFATERYQELGEDIAGAGDFDLGIVERKVFPDEERYRRIETDCARRDVVVIGGTVDDVDMLEIYDLACGLVHLGVHTLTLVLPWFGYQTMERASKRDDLAAFLKRIFRVAGALAANADAGDTDFRVQILAADNGRCREDGTGRGDTGVFEDFSTALLFHTVDV